MPLSERLHFANAIRSADHRRAFASNAKSKSVSAASGADTCETDTRTNYPLINFSTQTLPISVPVLAATVCRASQRTSSKPASERVSQRTNERTNCQCRTFLHTKHYNAPTSASARHARCASHRSKCARARPSARNSSSQQRAMIARLPDTSSLVATQTSTFLFQICNVT